MHTLGRVDTAVLVLHIRRKLGRIARRQELASKVLEGLRGDAIKVAMDLGREMLICPSGIPVLVASMEDAVNLKKEQEATERCLLGQKRKVPLSRQPTVVANGAAPLRRGLARGIAH